MPGHATVLNLLSASDIDEKILRDKLDVDRVTIIPGEDIRDLGVSQILQRVRDEVKQNQSGTFVIYTFDWTRQSRRTSLYALAVLVPVRKRCAVDSKGKITGLSFTGFAFEEYPRSIAQKISGVSLLRGTGNLLNKGLALTPSHRTASRGSIKHILYMRTDLWYSVKAGGSVGHIAGVIHGFVQNNIDVRILSWGRPPLVDSSVEFSEISPDSLLINDRELAILAYNEKLVKWALHAGPDERPDAVYARYGLHSRAPVTIAEIFNVPLIIEYNGSEVWIEKNWGRGLRYPRIAERIEEYVLRNADLITVVSKPLKDELAKRGFDGNRIIVNPNSVDPDRFSPQKYPLDEIRDLRKKLDIPESSRVAGFIGTFSPWHGVEVLAKAIPHALSACPNLHFLLIGGGPLFEKVKSELAAANAGTANVLDRVTLTGLIAQHEAPKYLMCCDFFLSPNVPNADGTPFFGSPTKLFEYMALGKGIIASDLFQLGEILTDGETALMVTPGDVGALKGAIERLYNDPVLSDQLGENARELVLKKYTWKSHVASILDGLYGL